MPTDIPSKADRALVDELRQAGLSDVSVWRLKRWRKEGLLPPPIQIRVTGRRGSASCYPPGTLEQALALARILERHRSFPKAAALLFAKGYTVTPNALRQAFAVGLDSIDAAIAEHARGVRDAHDVPPKVATAVVSQLRSSKKPGFWQRLLAT